MGKNVTIKEIAEQLNMSRNTVAKALNGEYVTEKTRQKVLEKAIELNYKSLITNPNKTSDRSYRFLLLSGKPLNNIKFFLPIIRIIENYCFQRNYSLYQFTYISGVTNFKVFYEYLISMKVDGIIVIETFDDKIIQQLISTNIPLSFIDFSHNANLINGNLSVVGSSNFTSFYYLTNKLINEYGIKKFTFVGDEKHCLSFQERYYGMLSALSNNNINHTKDEDILKSDNYAYGSFDMLMGAICKLKEHPDCFVCGNDFIARNIIRVLERLNIKVPDDCMVFGYDNTSDSHNSSPKITSVATNQNQVGLIALETLIQRIKNNHMDAIRHVIHSTIIERETTIRKK